MPLKPWQGGPPQMKSTSPGSGIFSTTSSRSARAWSMHSCEMLSEQSSSRPAFSIARRSTTLQFSANTAESALFSWKARAAHSSYSIAQRVSATLAWCIPSDSPPHPAKMSIVRRTVLQGAPRTSPSAPVGASPPAGGALPTTAT